MKILNQPSLIALSASAALLVAGCQSGTRSEDAAYVERPVEALYNAAIDEIDQRDYEQAIVLFNEVERQHPYSEWARRSTLMSAFSSYRSRRYVDAISTAERYIALHPGTEGAAYAYYLIGVSQFEQIVDVGRDQRTTELAKAALDEVVRRFPESEYAKDAGLKIDMVDDQLAGKEMAVGRWYLRRNQHLSAINRFRTVVTDYQTTSHTPEALHRLVEGYLSIGLREEAQAAGAVLGYNYPDSVWYRDSYRLLTGAGLNPEAVDETKREGFLSRLF